MSRARARASHRAESAAARSGMRPLPALIPFDSALAQALELAAPIDRQETVPLLDALGRVVAMDIRATTDVPPADRAAMDGYAVLARDTGHAGKFDPVRLRVQETLYAASVPTKTIRPGRCSVVATGATMPAGADAVVMVEDTEREKDTVKIYRPVRACENVSVRGGDLRRHARVVAKEEVLTAAKLGALAAVGRDRVAVYAKPRVALVVTGNEVVPPGGPLRPGQVYDINSNTMACVVRENGGEPVFLGRVPDRLDALRDALWTAADEDLVLFSGGSSVGEKDLVIDVLRSMGDLIFHGMAIRPGRPTVLGRVRNKAVLGMPGNPTSCLSVSLLLVAPMLRKMARLPPSSARTVEVPLATRVASVVGRVDLLTVRLVEGSAVPAYKESGAITSMAHADGYIEIPADVALLEKGQRVRVNLF